MVDLFNKHKKADRVLYHINIDYLSFVRWFAWEQLVLAEAKTTDYQLISYNSCYNVTY